MAGWRVFLATMLAFSGALSARYCGAADVRSETASSVPLEFQQVSWTVMNVGVAVDVKTHPFAKEPPISRNVKRGQFSIATGTERVRFLWDRSAGRLYLDLNHNNDLTDDTSGVHQSSRAVDSRYGAFTNVTLGTPGEADPAAIFDLQFHEYGWGLNAYAALKSFWSAKITLDGRDWQAGFIVLPGTSILQAENRRMLLRPWQSRERPFSVGMDSAETFLGTGPVFIQTQAYDIEVSPGRPVSPSGFQVTFKGCAMELGELELTGQFIEQLSLLGPCHAVFADAGQALRLPVGDYEQFHVRLGRSNLLARSLQTDFSPGREAVLRVTARTSARLTAGGPLTNTVTVRRRGGSLQLSYRLVGADGRDYELDPANRSDPPRFTVFHEGRKIASGTFEYG